MVAFWTKFHKNSHYVLAPKLSKLLTEKHRTASTQSNKSTDRTEQVCQKQSVSIGVESRKEVYKKKWKSPKKKWKKRELNRKAIISSTSDIYYFSIVTSDYFGGCCYSIVSWAQK